MKEEEEKKKKRNPNYWHCLFAVQNMELYTKLQINVDQIRDDHFYAFQLLIIHSTYQFMKFCCCG